MVIRAFGGRDGAFGADRARLYRVRPSRNLLNGVNTEFSTQIGVV